MLVKLSWHNIPPDGSCDGCADGITNLGENEDDSCNTGEILMGDTGLSGCLSKNSSKTTTSTLNDLYDDKLSGLKQQVSKVIYSPRPQLYSPNRGHPWSES
jgi:hypothetical protein